MKNIRTMSAMMREEIELCIQKAKESNGKPVNVTRLLNVRSLSRSPSSSFLLCDSQWSLILLCYRITLYIISLFEMT